jgi:hypothetical protein
METVFGYESEGDCICEWADGVWCYMSELSQMTDKSDDFTVHHIDSQRWNELRED